MLWQQSILPKTNFLSHNDLCLSPRQTIKVIQVYAPNSNPQEAEVEWFCEDLQYLLEITPKKDVHFIIGDWNVRVESQETQGITGKLALEYRIKQGKE